MLFDQPDVSFVDAIRHNGRLYGSKHAVIADEDSLTWRQFDRRTCQVANALLGAGLEPGGRVVLLASTSVRAFEIIWGTVRAGGCIVPLSTMLTADIIGQMLESAKPSFIFVDDHTSGIVESSIESHPSIGENCRFFTLGEGETTLVGDGNALIDGATAVDPQVEISPSDSMTIIYSSGSTGVPKGVEHSHAARLVYPLGIALPLSVDRHAITLCTTPLYTNGTWVVMLPTVFHGGTVVLTSKFSAETFLSLVAEHAVTHAFLVPTQMGRVLAAPALPDTSTHSLKVLLHGGAPTSGTTREEWARAFPNAIACEIWGMTEGIVTVATPEDRKIAPNTVGKPISAGDLRAVRADDTECEPGETGELVSWNPGLMKGYFNNEQATLDAIWRDPAGRTYLRSGDLGHLDEMGYIHVSGRLKDMIISGGINVYASDIEDTLMKYPQVREVAVIGVPDADWGESPIAFVITHDGRDVGADDIKEWANQTLSKYQRVKEVILCEDFPRVAHDKVSKAELRRPYLVDE